MSPLIEGVTWVAWLPLRIVAAVWNWSICAVVGHIGDTYTTDVSGEPQRFCDRCDQFRAARHFTRTSGAEPKGAPE